ncbi:MAG: selenide, water dikinase SelD [Myxococcaceae bacterium]
MYRLNDRQAIVQTVAFFPPIVHDPMKFGEIAAAHAMSDLWAMGAKPLFALNLVAFPGNLPTSMRSKILAGGQKKADEAGIPIVGERHIQGDEPKYGMAVTGVVDPRRVLTPAGARPGDVLILTKPLGSGIATTAIERGVASRALARRAIDVMSALNKAAGEVLADPKLKTHALTGVAGDGLLGHLWGMMKGAKTRAHLFLPFVPVIEGVPALSADGVVPGGTKDNLQRMMKKVRFPKDFPEPIKWVLADVQTHGGLLAAVPGRTAPRALDALAEAGVGAVAIGEVTEGRPGIEVIV